MKQVVVTGASGFLGAHLCFALLKKGYLVRALVKKNEDYSRIIHYQQFYSDVNTQNLTVATGFLEDVDSLIGAFQGVDTVFHCAALVGFRKTDHEKLMEINHKGTENVVNACLFSGVKNIVHTSSVAALGRVKDQNCIDENSEWVDSPLNTSYAVSKHLAETEIWRGVEEGLNASIINPGIILGPCFSKSGTGIIYERARKGSRLYPPGSNGFVGVTDVADMMVSVFEEQLWGMRFVAVAENLSYKQVLEMFADGYKKPKPNIAIPGALIVFGSVVLGFFESLNIHTPWPAEGLISTGSKNLYKPFNYKQLKNFHFTQIGTIIRNSCL